MRSEQISIPNAAGIKLAARLDLPVDGKPIAYALFAHCFTCTKNLRAVTNISRALTQQGFGVLRFDFTGLGESDGDFADTNFSSNVADLVTVADYLATHYAAPQLLIGHSLGGAAVLQAAAQIPSAEAVVTLGAPAKPDHVKQAFQESLETIAATGEATVQLAGRPFTIKKQFLDDLAATKMQATIRNLKRALLVMHSPLDHTVGIDNAAEIFTAAKHPKSFISLDQADHLLMDAADSLYAGTMIAAWVQKYIARPAESVTLLTPQKEQVVVRTEKSYTSQVLACGHGLLLDEPLAVGGNNLGPTPYEYLLAGLGGCTGITLRMYADRKGWPLDAVEVHLRHAKIHAADCATCEEKAAQIDQIERTVTLEGVLSDEQRARLLAIAEKCPVHRTLHNEIRVVTQLVNRAADVSQ
jgi:putative redox protein